MPPPPSWVSLAGPLARLPCAPVVFAQRSLHEMADAFLEENGKENNGPRSVLMPFVSSDGIMLKRIIMNAVKIYRNLEGKETVFSPSSYQQIVAGTY